MVYTVLRRLSSYLKGYGDGIIDKDLFIQMRKLFPKEYIGACKFYNSNNTNEITNSIQSILDHNYKIQLSTISSNLTSTLQSQYQSLSKIVQDSLNSVNGSTVFKLINTIKDSDSLKIRKRYLKTVIKSLVLLSIVDHIEHVFNTTTLHEDLCYNLITDWKSSQLTTLLEHIDDDISTFSNDPMMLFEVDDGNSDNSNDNVFDDSDDDSTPDLIEDTITDDMRRIFFLTIHKLINIVEKMASIEDNRYRSLLPNISYIAYYTIVIAMLVSNSL